MGRTVSRREFLRRGVAWGLAGSGLAALFAACRGAGGQAGAPASPAPLSPAFLPARGTATALRAGGASAGGDLPPILFVHGNGNSSALWLTAAWRFAANGWPRERLLALDFPYPTARDDDAVPQAGRSGTDDQRAQLVDAIDAVLGRTGASRVVLIGSSRGGNAIRDQRGIVDVHTLCMHTRLLDYSITRLPNSL